VKKVFLVIALITFIMGGAYFVYFSRVFFEAKKEGVKIFPFETPQSNLKKVDSKSNPKVEILAEGLDTPWAIAFLPEGGMLITERKGSVRLLDKDGNLKKEPVAEIASVREEGEGGLLGITLHPEFSSNHLVYLYYTYSNFSGQTFNRVIRMTFADEKLEDEKIIVDKIPGAANHNGGRIKFGPDGFLYITTGDSQNPSLAQDVNSLAGKILRVTDDGKAVSGNPFGNMVFSFGHRNPQGITWDGEGNLWETEHGPSGLETGNDEFNKIEVGKNYGWPEIRGKQAREGMVTPLIESGRGNTWAPAGLAFLKGKFYFGGLRGQALYRVEVKGEDVRIEKFFEKEFGRIREVMAGQDGMLYITTSNRDGRGNPKEGDDKIIRINPDLL